MEKGHGRIETRAVQARTVRSGELDFPLVAQIARIDRRREWPDGKQETEAVFVLTSCAAEKLSELALAEAVRTHWSIENGLHYRRDRSYDEDRSQIRHRGTAQVIATMRNLAIAVRHHLAPSCRRKRDRTLPQMHRRLAAKPHLALALLIKPWR